MSGGLVEFLRARLDEDEWWAREASRHDEEPVVEGGEHWRWECTEDHVVAPDPGAEEFMECPVDELWAMSLRSVEQYPYSFISGEGPSIHLTTDSELRAEVGGHIARHDPARVLAEVEAKRRIVDLAWHHLGDDDYAWGMEEAKRQILAELATVYADHPDYDEGWRP